MKTVLQNESRTLRRLLWLGWVMAAVVTIVPARAMPPHPELIERLQNAAARQCYFLQHEAELRAQGVNSPTQVDAIRERAGGRSLDENFNVIAILVDFSDQTALTAAGSFDNLLYGTSFGTLRNYYDEITYGNLTLVTLNMPSALGWLRAPQTYAYYVDGQNGFGSYPHNAQRLAEDAVALANPFVNFANYDNDGNGSVEALFIIHSGQGAEWTGSDDDIWSHKWQMSSPQYVDGVYAYVYSMEPEYWSSAGDMTCGVYAHEMGHSVFGLPDLYDYGYDSNGLGKWSLMAGGSWNGTRGGSPAHPDAWSRQEMGVAIPTVVTVNTMGASIPAIETTPTIYRLWTNGATGSQFFLVENRRRVGYDAALPSQGLMIYHVDETQSGNNNQWYPGYTTNGHYLVALEQADGLWHLEQETNSGDAGDPFPGSAVKRTFDASSTPDSRDYNFNDTQVAVRNISNSASTMTADLYVIVTPYLTVNAPDGGETWYTGNSQNITWASAGFSGNVKIELNRGYPGTTWETLFANTANDGIQAWTVSGGVSTQARVRVTSLSVPSVGDTSGGNFTIAAPFINITSPLGGGIWFVGQTRTITWTSAGFTSNVAIHLNRNYPSGAWETLQASTANDGSEVWAVTGPVSSLARIRIRSVNDTSISGLTSGNFAVADPFVTLLVPNGGERWDAGSAQQIVWSSGGFTGNVRIEINRSYPGGTWEELYASAANDDNELWTVIGPPTPLARMRISSVEVPALTDISNANFTITSAPPRLFHDALADFEPGAGTVTAITYSPYAFLTISAVKMFYRETGGTFFDSLELTATGNPDEYAANLGLIPNGSYEYYVQSVDHVGLSTKVPAAAPGSLYSFDVGEVCGTEIGYDDGTAERFNHSNELNGTFFRWAVKFGPLPVPYVLCGLRFAAARTIPDTLHTPVRVYVYAADGFGGLPGTLLHDEITGSIGNRIGGLPAQTTWAQVLLKDDLGGLLVVNDSEFYVGVGNLETGKYEAFGRDTDGASAERSVFYDPCVAQWFSEEDTLASNNAYPGNRMIRISGYALVPPEVTIYRVADAIELRWSDTGAPLYHVYAAATADGLYELVDSTTDTMYSIPDIAGLPAYYFFRIVSATE
ncbi:M6 family metalloprotease domain-containing protein [bacterium]|nr:M6 family metalloprotease domain-containing protein [bacterium]MBU1985282.1 M6 family metalloprotease domain-containing protein [bacterium]